MENRVEKLRKERGLNQEDFAKAIRVSRQTVSSIENGKYNPSLELAFAIADNYLNRGIICVLVGICFILAAVFTESALDGLLWGFAGGALGPGIGMIIMHFYWSLPQNAERFKEKQEQKEIEVHDELNEKLRDKSGRIAYLIGLSVICVSVVVFAILGKMGVITDYKIVVLYLYGLMVFQIAAGVAANWYLRQKY